MQVKLTKLKQIPVDGGDVYHIINSDSMGFRGFGEVYISFVKAGTSVIFEIPLLVVTQT